MPETTIESILDGSLSLEVLSRWLSANCKEDSPEDCETFSCTRSEFVAYFLCYLRSQTQSILQTNSNALQILQHQGTPEKLLSFKTKDCPASGNPNAANAEHHGTNTRQRSHESPNRDRGNVHKKPGRRVKTKLFNEMELSDDRFEQSSTSFANSTNSNCTGSDESNLSAAADRLMISSTPMKYDSNRNSTYPQLPITSPVTPRLEPLNHSKTTSKFNSSSNASKDYHTERCDTPRMSTSYSRHRNSSSEKSTLNLGDYITKTSRVSSKKKKTKNISNESAPDNSSILDKGLDLSSSDMFPEIGAKQSKKLSRRINPTNIDGSSSSGKSFTMNSFNSNAFEQPSPIALEENAAFKQQKFQPKELSQSFDCERNMLKQERSKLLEKFNGLNVMSASKVSQSTPQIKVLQCKSKKPCKYVEADIGQVNYKDKLETLVEIYDVLLRNNLVLSISAEVYLLISILLSKQYEDEYETVESKLSSFHNESVPNDNKLLISDYLLRSVHNCSYFAVKSLWRQKYVLELMLDKHSLKLLGENRRVRGFYPDLAKFLLNLYSLKCEREMWNREEKSELVPENRFANSVVCFNSETDNADNFPTLMSFQNFKKQRDMFYEILRWWSDSDNQSLGSARTSLRSRVKSLISIAIAPANHAHLARLLRSHMLTECIATSQESKLSKLQRRLTGPAPTPSVDSHRLPRFTPREEFYRDFLLFAESEGFRTHVRDSLASEMCALDAACLSSTEDLANCSEVEASREYLHSLRKLRLLAKFLGYLHALPYSGADHAAKTGVMAPPAPHHSPPKEKVLCSEIAKRNCTQPPLDLMSLLDTAYRNNRLCITVPWIVQYLAMLDYTSLRIRYYNQLLKYLFRIYTTILRIPDETNKNTSEVTIRKSTSIFLKLCLGWLFDLQHFPQDLFFSDETLDLKTPKVQESLELNRESESETGVDFVELVDEQVLSEVCPYLKELNVLLLTSQPSKDVKEVGSTFRHITPVTTSLTPSDRKEKELQARLEAELIRGQGSSTRRVLELVADRVTSATIKELASTVLVQSRNQCRAEALPVLRLWQERNSDTPPPLETLRTMYACRLREARQRASELASVSVRARACSALGSLLAAGTARAPLEAVVRRACLTRIHRWIRDNWADVSVLCKDIEGEMQNLLVLGSGLVEPPSPPPLGVFTYQRMLLPSSDFFAANISPAALMIQIREATCELLDEEFRADPGRLVQQARICCSPKNVFLSPPARRTLQQLSIDFAVVLLAKQLESMTEEFLNLLNEFWNDCCPNRKRQENLEDSLCLERRGLTPELRFDDDDHALTPPSSDDENAPKITKIVMLNDAPVELGEKKPNGGSSVVVEGQEELLEYFDRILCPRNVVLFSRSPRGVEVWDSVAVFLLFLLRNDYMSEDSLTEQCLAVYRQDWPQRTLEGLSRCARAVAGRRGASDKMALLLHFLAEFCTDIHHD